MPKRKISRREMLKACGPGAAAAPRPHSSANRPAAPSVSGSLELQAVLVAFAAGSRSFPSGMGATVPFGIVAAGFGLFALVAKHLPVFGPLPGSAQAAAPDARRGAPRAPRPWHLPRGLSLPVSRPRVT